MTVVGGSRHTVAFHSIICLPWGTKKTAQCNHKGGVYNSVRLSNYPSSRPKLPRYDAVGSCKTSDWAQTYNRDTLYHFFVPSFEMFSRTTFPFPWIISILRFTSVRLSSTEDIMLAYAKTFSLHRRSTPLHFNDGRKTYVR